MDRRTLLVGGGLALTSLGATARKAFASVIEAPGFFTFEAQMVAHNPNDAALAAFASGAIDRFAHFNGAHNSLSGQIRVDVRNRSTRLRLYPGPAQFHVWGSSGRGLDRACIRDASGERPALPRPKPYPVTISSFGPAEWIFDLSGGDMSIAFPQDFFTAATKAQWCAPTVPGIRPRPDIGIPYTPAEIAWHMGKPSTFTTTFFLVNG